jgi:DNA-binding transcriptional ArsR family regulator
VTRRTSKHETPSRRVRRTASDIEPHAQRAAELLKALANEQRLMILCHLVGGSLSVGELNDEVPLSQSALSQHLAILRAAGIVTTSRVAQSIRYSLPRGVVTELIAVLNKEFCGR